MTYTHVHKQSTHAQFRKNTIVFLVLFGQCNQSILLTFFSSFVFFFPRKKNQKGWKKRYASLTDNALCISKTETGKVDTLIDVCFSAAKLAPKKDKKKKVHLLQAQTPPQTSTQTHAQVQA